ncbi:hypothetical protein ROHU_030193 [Labeo rohita]|uniref:Uncharacterized protein n=1 Tax=Labeo rohita TaxID=84645 RepID=A0A498M1L3_LABRO|nr:hypothetical protein ROHU_030193 [Labeo rohita]
MKFEFWAKIEKKEETGNFHGDIQSSHLEKRVPDFITNRPYLECIPFSEALSQETVALEILDFIKVFYSNLG